MRFASSGPCSSFTTVSLPSRFLYTLKKWRISEKADREAVLRTFRDYVESTPDKKFRKNPETYLNQRAWEFEIIQAPTTTMQVRPPNTPISKIRRTVDAVQEAQRIIRQQSEQNH